MPKQFTEDFQRTINSVEASESPLILVEINHQDLASPIRVLNDSENLTSNGKLFQKFAFRFSGIQDPEVGLSEATLSLDNVGKELVQWLEIANLRLPTTVRFQTIRRSDPDQIQVDTTLFLDDIRVTPQEVTGRLSYGLKIDDPMMIPRYTRGNSPGLFQN